MLTSSKLKQVVKTCKNIYIFIYLFIYLFLFFHVPLSRECYKLHISSTNAYSSHLKVNCQTEHFPNNLWKSAANVIF